MPLVTPLSLSVQWNEDFHEEMLLREDDGTPVDLTNFSVALQVRAAAGAGGSALLTATVTELAETGYIQVHIAKASIAGVSNGQHVWRGAWDIRLTDSVTGYQSIWARGPFIIEPGVTQ